MENEPKIFKDQIIEAIGESIAVKAAILDDDGLLENIVLAVKLCIRAYRAGGKILLCGNGGSASDAQHISAELTGRFRRDRPPLHAEALHVNGSYLTAVANDYGYDEVFARMVRAKGNAGDILIALSTSGNSQNVVLAAKMASEREMQVIGLTGSSGGSLASFVNVLVNVPSQDTARIQEAHILIGHIFCDLIEQTLFP